MYMFYNLFFWLIYKFYRTKLIIYDNIGIINLGEYYEVLFSSR